jgi:hypothetical protein
MNFLGGSPPVETDTGESRRIGRRTGLSSVSVSVYLGVQVNVQSALGQDACPDPGSWIVPGDFDDGDRRDCEGSLECQRTPWGVAF